jgi:hypothetical protein
MFPMNRRLIAVTVTVAIFCLSLACSYHEVNTWERWCEQVGAVDLEKKYNRWGAVFSVSFKGEAIRSDFVQKFNSMVVADAAQRHLAGSKPSDRVVEELVRLRMLGIWREATDLHWSNSLLEKDAALGLDDFRGLVTSIQNGLAEYRGRKNVSESDRCLYGTLDGVFDHVSIHGPDSSIVTIDLRHTLREN